MAVNSTYIDGTKNIPIEALDTMLFPEFFDSADAGISEREAYNFVAWVYRAVQLRANALSSIPFTVQTSAGQAQDRIDFQSILPRLLQLTEASLSLHGEAYWLKEINLLNNLLAIRWAVASTIKLKTDPIDGLVGFTRTIQGVPKPLTKDDVCWFWLPDPEVELGHGQAPAQVALEAAGINRNINRYSSAFFKSGAINPTILSVTGNPGKQAMRELESWWNRLATGIKNAWTSRVLRSEVTVTRLTSDLKDMAMPDLTKNSKEQIAAAFGVPITMLEDAANFATAKEHRVSFWRDSVVPDAKFIAGSLNEQLFEPMGLEFAFVFEDIEVLQQDEATKTDSVISLVDAGLISPMEGREMLNLAERTEVDEADIIDSAEVRALDLKRWQKVALKELVAGNNPAHRYFRSEHIGAGLYETIHGRLAGAETKDEVRAAFAASFPVADYGHSWAGYP